MQAITILDIKPFMQLLFQTDQLDSYDFLSADIRTDITYSLDGHINKGFYSEEELSLFSLESKTCLPWSLAKEKVFTIIKGKKTPSLLKVVLKVSDAQTSELLAATNSALHANDIDGMFLNIMFQENKLNVVCGISYQIFTLDKNLESEFTNNIVTLFKSYGITCEV